MPNRLQNIPKLYQYALKKLKKLQFEQHDYNKKVSHNVLSAICRPKGDFDNFIKSFLHYDGDVEGFVCKSDIFRSLDSSAS